LLLLLLLLLLLPNPASGVVFSLGLTIKRGCLSFGC